MGFAATAGTRDVVRFHVVLLVPATAFTNHPNRRSARSASTSSPPPYRLPPNEHVRHGRAPRNAGQPPLQRLALARGHHRVELHDADRGTVPTGVGAECVHGALAVGTVRLGESDDGVGADVGTDGGEGGGAGGGGAQRRVAEAGITCRGKAVHTGWGKKRHTQPTATHDHRRLRIVDRTALIVFFTPILT